MLVFESAYMAWFGWCFLSGVYVSEIKTKKCKVCKSEFKVFLSTQKVCGVECAIITGKADREKKLKKERQEEERVWRKKKQDINDTIPNWTKKAQVAFNEYIRLRDHDKPCISCGRYGNELTTNSVRGGSFDCGHYRSVGANPELRFEPLNAHKQCKLCNSHKSGNHVEYRFGIAARITPSELEWVEGPHKPKRYRVEELKEICKEFRAKSKEIKKMMGDM